MADQTLFEKYGGFSSVSKVVLAFYDTLLDSDDIGPFFDDIDMSRMVDHQTKFVASLPWRPGLLYRQPAEAVAFSSGY